MAALRWRVWALVFSILFGTQTVATAAEYDAGETERIRANAYQEAASKGMSNPGLEAKAVVARELLEKGRSDLVLLEIDPLLDLSPSEPLHAKALLLQAPILVGIGKVEEAEASWKQVASTKELPELSSQARIDLLRHYWRRGEFAKYVEAAESIPEGIAGFDEGESALNSGYVYVSEMADLEEARRSFQEVAWIGGKRAAEARAALKWVEAVGNAASQTSVADDFEQLLRDTQGGVTKEISAELIGRRTLDYLEAIQDRDMPAATRLAEAISSDPVYGIYGARAKAFQARARGREAALAAQEQLVVEEAAAQQKEAALKAIKNGENEVGIALLDELIAEGASEFVLPDVRLRKGYALIRTKKREEAAEAFETALVANAALGADHPYNLEALARLRSLKHGKVWKLQRQEQMGEIASGSSSEPLEDVLKLTQQWIDALPQDSPDVPRAYLEQGGILFEQAVALKSPQTWDDVRNYLRSVLIENSDYPQQIRAVAALMHLESYYYEDRCAELIEAVPAFVDDYPGSWREIGTAKLFEWTCHIRQGEWEKAHDVMAWVRQEVPEDAPIFATADFHMAALCDEALAASHAKNDALATSIIDKMMRKDAQNRYTLFAQSQTKK
ncbi:MAG: hypothetical protein RLY93_20805 [Sumerlaeia bacterium]